jgi:hypothetical protein
VNYYHRPLECDNMQICSAAQKYQDFEVVCCLHLLGRRVNQAGKCGAAMGMEGGGGGGL